MENLSISTRGLVRLLVEASSLDMTSEQAQRLLGRLTELVRQREPVIEFRLWILTGCYIRACEMWLACQP